MAAASSILAAPSLAASSLAAPTLAVLRRQIAAPFSGPGRGISVGDARIDRHLPGGGLPIGQLHEIASTGMQTRTAAVTAGFAALLAGALLREDAPEDLQERVVLWVAPRCDLYAPGLLPYGIDPGRLIVVQTDHDSQTLQTMETALRSGAAAAVVGEVRGVSSLAARRLRLACLHQASTALLLRRYPQGPVAQEPVALGAVTRWQVDAEGLRSPGPALSRWHLRLTHARGGRSGEWVVEVGDAANGLSVVSVLGDDAVAPWLRAAG